ncbi:carbohydrate binding domain-containing protein [Streptomyces niveus]|uniref:carbohydrate binding domain-containing protein n=1 Tax=Streptomyces niveus TaxID=193462 RepID=UPI0036D26592
MCTTSPTAAPGPRSRASAWSRLHRLGARTVALGAATGMLATFNNGNGVWDNNSGGNYTVPAGLSTVRNGTVTKDAADPPAPPSPRTPGPRPYRRR